ncbi:MAG: YwiC-like family protein, partial [Deltaproteobacteria bacterium]|nr:YwiC-like family protein [Deltaproteobacteria bacterium]
MGKPSESRSLLPREHGAYGQIVMPLLCGLALGRPGAAAWLLAAGAF